MMCTSSHPTGVDCCYQECILLKDILVPLWLCSIQLFSVEGNAQTRNAIKRTCVASYLCSKALCLCLSSVKSIEYSGDSCETCKAQLDLFVV
jgi:hypothetical protein